MLVSLLCLLVTLKEAESRCGESECGVYPSCSQYGPGQWEILEQCHRYIKCTRDPTTGQLKQQNLECPGDLVFANEYGECVEYDKATECKTFNRPSTPCLYSCPRIYIESSGIGAIYQQRRLGCFRISGTLFGGTLVHYQNENGQYLTPDSTSNPTTIHWIVSETPGAFNGGIRNTLFDYIRCPFPGWDQGWEVDTGLGHWVSDPTMKVRCHMGEEDVCTSSHPIDRDSTTPRVSPCHKEGPTTTTDCTPEFICCGWDGVDQDWVETHCTCKHGNVFSLDFELCTNPEMCDLKEYSLSWGLGSDHTCEDGSTCW